MKGERGRERLKLVYGIKSTMAKKDDDTKTARERVDAQTRVEPGELKSNLL